MPVNLYTDIALCNAALDLIGESGINTLTEPKTDIEASCATQFTLVIANLLSLREWSFSTRLRQLAASADIDAENRRGYAYAHALPSNLLAGPFAICGSNNDRDTITDYALDGNYVLSDSPVVYARYCAQTDLSSWPLYFINLCVVALASRLAKPVADNTELATELRIQAFGSANEEGRGGLFATAASLDAKAKPMRSLFANGDPLSATRR